VNVQASQVGTPTNKTSAFSDSTVDTPPGTVIKQLNPDLAIDKAASKAQVNIGDALAYTLSVSNVSGGPTTGTITVTDTVPAGLTLNSVTGGAAWTCTTSGNALSCTYNLGQLNVGQSAAPITVNTTVNSSAPNSLVNTGVVATPGDTNPGNNQDTVTTPVVRPDLAILKTANQSAVNVGETLIYTLAVNNVGAGTTTGTVTVTDTVPTGLTLTGVNGAAAWTCTTSGSSLSCTYNGGALAAGATAPAITVTTTVNAAAPAQLVNTGVVSTPGDTNPGNDRSTVTTPVLNPDLAILKTVNVPSVTQGGTLTYTLTVTNVGTGPTTGRVNVTDTLPAGLTLTSINAGTQWACATTASFITCDYTGPALTGGNTVGSTAPGITIVAAVARTATGTLVNTGVVSTPGDNNPANDRSTVQTPILTEIAEQPETPGTIDPPPAPPGPPTPPKKVKPDLPFTGADTTVLVQLGLGTLLAGGMLLVLARPRRRTT